VKPNLTEPAGNSQGAELCPRVAVYGTGSIGMRHLRVLRDACGAKVYAVPIRITRAAELQSDGFTVASSLEEAAALGTRLAVIATDTKRHVPDLRKALEFGMDVLVEKPLSPSADELNGLGALIRKLNRHVYVGCTLRFDPGLNLFRRRLHEIGALHSVRIECQSYLPEWRPNRDYRECYSARADEGGVLRDLIHEIDYAVWLFGRPQELWASLNNTRRLGIEAEEECDVNWRTPSGANVSIRLDYLTRHPRRGMHASGELGEITWDAIGGRVAVAIAGKSAEEIETRQERDDTIADQARAFIGAVAGADAGTMATFADGAFAVSVCDAARRSSLTNKVESIAERMHISK
jgi:predicted dehydrogenase